VGFETGVNAGLLINNRTKNDFENGQTSINDLAVENFSSVLCGILIREKWGVELKYKPHIGIKQPYRDQTYGSFADQSIQLSYSELCVLVKVTKNQYFHNFSNKLHFSSGLGVGELITASQKVINDDVDISCNFRKRDYRYIVGLENELCYLGKLSISGRLMASYGLQSIYLNNNEHYSSLAPSRTVNCNLSIGFKYWLR
jgi:hypothetical protein